MKKLVVLLALGAVGCAQVEGSASRAAQEIGIVRDCRVYEMDTFKGIYIVRCYESVAVTR